MRARAIITLAATLAALAPGACLKLDAFLYDSWPASLDDYDFTSEALDGIAPERITSVLVPVGESGERIHVLYVERDPDELDPRIDPDSRATVLFSHGNTGNNLRYWYRVGYFEDMGFNVAMYDYRGFGASDGETSEAHVYEDVAAVWDWLRARVDVGEIVSAGYSMGGAPAIWLCSRDSGREPAACFTEAAFESVEALAQAGSGYDFPGDWFADAAFDNLSRIGRVDVPFLLMHGDRDATVDVGQAYALWKRVRYRNPANRLFVVHGATHRNVPLPAYEGSEEPREYSHPDELPPALRENFEIWKSRVVDLVADALED